ncbi:hypothetical protein [Frankia sp. Cas3]|uniref:hypothetical protein n=2 Tax=unclassified Frankia TaxID=2632575 RepID=UPI002AD2725B|nr:hypothetical protein [Frankia sp. Cas3]
MNSSLSAHGTSRDSGLSRALVRYVAAAGIALVAVFSATAATDLSTAGTPLILSAMSSTATTSGTTTRLGESSLPQLVHVV